MTCKCPPNNCIGPCYDFCMCSHCWWGWKGLKVTTRIKYRLRQVWWDLIGKDPAL